MRNRDTAGNLCYQYEVTTYDNTAPPPASRLTGLITKDPDSGNLNANLDWQPSAEAEVNYIIEYKVQNETDWQETHPHATTHLTLPLAQIGYNHRIEFRVYAVDAAGNRSTASPQPANPCYVYTPVLMGNLSAEGITQNYTYAQQSGDYDRRLQWQLEGGIVSAYVVELNPPAAAGAEVQIQTTELGTHFTANGLQARTTYTLTIYGKDNNDLVSGHMELTYTLANYRPGKPVPLSPLSRSTDDEFNFQWQPAPDADELDLTYNVIVHGPGGQEHTLPSVTNTTTCFFEAATAGFNLTHNTTYSWEVVVADTPLSGEEPLTNSSGTENFLVDADKPQISFSYNTQVLYLTEDMRVYIDPSLSEIATGAVSYETTAGQTGTAENLVLLTEGTHTGYYTATIPLHHSDNLYDLTVWAETTAGNQGVNTLTGLLVDRNPPVISGLQILEGDDGNSYWTADSALSLELSAHDTLAGLQSLEYTILAAADDPVAEENLTAIPLAKNPGDSQPAVYPLQLESGLSDKASGYLVIRLTDHAGNSSDYTLAAQVIRRDSTPPVFDATLKGTSSYAGLHYSRNPQDLAFTFTAEDPESGIREVLYTVAAEDSAANPVDKLSWSEDWNTVTGSLNPADGESCTFYTKTVNYSGLATTLQDRVVFDNSGPENLKLTWNGAPPFVPGQTAYAKIEASEEQGGVSVYSLAIGTEAGDTSLSGLISGNEAGWLRQEQNEFAFIVPDAIGSYVVTIAAKNGAGITTTGSTTYPLPIYAELEKIAVRAGSLYQKETTTLPVSWQYIGSQPVSGFEYRILGPGYAGSSWQPGTPSGPPDSPLDGLTLQQGESYQVEVRAVYTDAPELEVTGLSPAILIDATPPQFADANGLVTPAAAHAGNLQVSWNILEEETELSELRLLVETLDENGERVRIGDDWLDLPPTKSGSLLLVSDNRGHTLRLADGQLLYLTLRATNQTKLAVLKAALPVIFDNSPPPAPLVGDQGQSIRLEQVTADGLDWDWNGSESDPESSPESYRWQLVVVDLADGLDAAQLLTGPGYLTEEAWQSAGSLRSLSLTGDNLPTDYQVAYLFVEATNRAGLHSLGYSDGIMADEDGPWISAVKLLRTTEEGEQEVHYVGSTENLRLQIEASDPQSGVSRYVGSYGSFIDGSFTQRGLPYPYETTPFNLGSDPASYPQLVPGETCVFRGDCYNYLELEAIEAGYTGSVMLDPDPPLVSEVRAEFVAGEFIVSWKAGSSYAPIEGYTLELWKMELVEGEFTPQRMIRREILPPETTSRSIKQSTHNDTPGLQPEDRITDGWYRLSVTAENAAGSLSVAATSKLVLCDTTAPQLALSLESDDPSGLYACNELVIAITAADNSGPGRIAAYEYSIGTPDAPDIYLSGGTEIKLTEINPRLTIDLHALKVAFEELKDASPLQVEVLCRDLNGNESETVSATLTLDLSPPEIMNLSLENDYISSNNALYGISFELADSGSGLATYRTTVAFSNEPAYLAGLQAQPELWQISGFLEGIHLYTETEYQSPAPRELVQEETCYLALLVEDSTGQQTMRVSDAITIDYEEPAITFREDTGSEPHEGEFVFNESPFSFFYQVEDLPGTQIDVVLSLENAHNSTLQTNLADPESQLSGTNTQVTYPFDETNYQSYTLRVRLEDQAGNVHTASRILRVNRPPAFGFGPLFETTPGKPLTLSINTEPEDSAGKTVYTWSFPDHPDLNTLFENQEHPEAPVLVLHHQGRNTHRSEYTVALTITDSDGKESAQQTTSITVLNTTSGALYEDETWVGDGNGIHTIAGEIIIPPGITLTIPGSTIVEVKPATIGEPYGIEVQASTSVQGEEPQRGQLTIGSGAEIRLQGANPQIYWAGIYPQPGSIVSIAAATIRQALCGITILPDAEVNLDGTTFAGNQIGIHVLSAGTTLEDCHITGSYHYGIKEEAGGTLKLETCEFENNNIHYYDKNETSLSEAELSTRNGNTDIRIVE